LSRTVLHAIVRRRAFLAATAALTTGCSSALGRSDPVRLDGPTVETDDGRTLYDFSRDGDHAVNLDVAVRPAARTDRSDRSDPPSRAQVVVSVGGQGEWTTTGLRLGLRAPAVPAAGERPARVFFEVSDPLAARCSTRTTGEGYAVVEADDLADAGLDASTLVLTFLLVPRSPSPDLSLRAATTHRSPDGTPAVAEVTDTVSLRPD
jgi:hypothetical protein